MNEVNQAEEGWKGIAVRGNSVCKGPVAERSMAQVMGIKGGLWSREAGAKSLRGRDAMLSTLSASAT